MFYLTAKFQKKVMNGFRETVQTDERMDGRDSLGLFSANRRETKKRKYTSAEPIFVKIGTIVHFDNTSSQ